METSLESACWHDGQLHGISFEMDATGAPSVKLSVSLYDGEQAPKREQFVVLCTGVSRFATSIDVAELKNNASAGNVGNGRIEGGLLFLELSGGSIEIEAKEFKADAV